MSAVRAVAGNDLGVVSVAFVETFASDIGVRLTPEMASRALDAAMLAVARECGLGELCDLTEALVAAGGPSPMAS